MYRIAYPSDIGTEVEIEQGSGRWVTAELSEVRYQEVDEPCFMGIVREGGGSWVATGSYARKVLGPDVPGGAPSLRPGDAVKVNGHVGVVCDAHTNIRGDTCEWDSPKLPAVEGNMPSYAITFRSNAGLKHAWWELSEIDEVVSLGPFHSDVPPAPEPRKPLPPVEQWNPVFVDAFTKELEAFGESDKK